MTNTSLEEIMKALPPEERKEVETRATELIAEEYARRELQENYDLAIQKQPSQSEKTESLK